MVIQILTLVTLLICTGVGVLCFLAWRDMRRKSAEAAQVYAHLMGRDAALTQFLREIHADLVSEVHAAAAGVDRSLVN